MSGVFAEALTREEVAAIEAELGTAASSSNLPPMLGSSSRERGGKTTVTYDELLNLRELEIPLDGLWVFVTNDELKGLVPATKIQKWLGLGYKAE